MEKILFLILGPSGSGKSEILRFITRRFPGKAAIISKLTTRHPLRTDVSRNSTELIFLSEQDFDKINPDYQYAYGSDRYGVTRDAIRSCLAENDMGLLVVGRAQLIRRIKKDFTDVDVVPIYVKCDYHKRKERLEALGHDQATVARKLGRDHDPALEYHEHEALYHELLLNDSPLDVFLKRVEAIVLKHVDQVNVGGYLGI
jgi:guanylate kinase